MARDSKVIKQDLVDDLTSSTDLLSAEQSDTFLVEPEELDERDDVSDRHVSLYFGTREPDINIDAKVPYRTAQEIVVQVYVQSHRLKDSEHAYEDLFDDLSDDVFDWIYDIADGNSIYDINSKLSVPTRNEGQYFVVQEEVIRTGVNTYTRFRFNVIRDSK